MMTKPENHIFYQSSLPDRKKSLFTLFCDIGWLILFFGVAMYLINGAEGLGSITVSVLFLLTFISAATVAVGVSFLIARRAKKSDIKLSKQQLLKRRGLLTYGSIGACIFSLSSITVDLFFHFDMGLCFVSQIMICIGALISSTFSFVILRSFKANESC